MTPVVLIAEELAPAAIDVLAHDFDVRHVDGTDRPALLAALAEADAVIVRSATQIDAEAIAAAPRLKVVARAGVGLDNVEVPAATARGVMVVNAPTSNIVSAAEQAVALLLAVARNTASASAALKAGEWKRSKYTGVEMQGKTVGVVGLGRIGVLFAQRIAAFGTRLIAYDPYVQPARAAQLGVRLVGPGGAAARRATSSRSTCPRPRRRSGLIGAKELATRQARRAHRQRRPRRPDRRAGAGRRARRGPGRRRRHRRVRQGAVHRLAAVRVRQRGGHPAPGRLHRRGAGQGRPGRRPQRQAGAAGRVRAGRGQRAGRRRGRRGRAAAAAAGREARPGLHRGRRRGRRQRHRRGARRDRRQRRRRCSSWPPPRACSPRWSRSRSPTSTRRCWPPTAASRSSWSPAPSSIDHPNLVTRARARCPTAARSSVAGTVVVTGTREIAQADRGRRLRPRAGRRGHPAVLPVRRPARAWSARRLDPRRGRASTSRRCRWPGARPAARR